MNDITGIPPAVVGLFEQLAKRLLAQGFKHYSARAILHQIRWHYQVEKDDREFTCNNNWTPRLARWCMEQHPELDGFFEIRASPNRHSMEDYGGPYNGA